MLKTNCSKVAKFVLILLIAPIVFVAYFTLQKAYAQTSSTINFQGKIVRNDTGYEGLNVTTGSPACVQSGADSCDFQVKYYSASTSGTLYFTETYTDVEIGQYGGIFNLSLGAGTPTTGTYSSLDAMIKAQDSVYVEILFSPAGNSTFTETFSRMPLQASAYAIKSKYAEYAKLASGAFKFENAANSTGYTGTDGMVYYDTTSGVLKLYSAGVWQDLATGGASIWGSNSITSYSHYPSQFMETSGIATLSNFGVDATVNRAWVHGASSRTGFSVYSNYSGATDWPLVTFKADASNFGNSILQLTQDGTGNILEGLSGSTPVFNFDKRGDLHLSSNGVNYFEPFAVAPTTGDLYPGSGEGCLYNVAGTLYWDATCNYNGAALSTGSSSRWTDAGSFTYLTSTTDDILFGGNSTATATFFFDVDASSGNYLAIDNAANTQRLFTIDSNGNVGIGTATPGSKLDIGGANSNITNSTGDITITPNQNLILGSGNFGVGTATPNQKLSVAGTFGIRETGTSPTYYTIFQGGDQSANITYTLPTTSTTGILANNGSGTLSWATLSSLGGVTGTGSGSGTAGQITFWSGTSTITGNNNFWWDNTNQRLGIGTSSPQASLDIAGATSEIANTSGDITISPASGELYVDGSVVLPYSGQFQFDDGSIAFIDENWGLQLNGLSTHPIQVLGGSLSVGYDKTSSGDWGSNNLYVAGNVGIGTTSPNYKLHVTETLNQNHSTIYGYANQTSTSTDYLSIGVEGLASGSNSTWGRSIGVWGHSDKANTYRSIGVIGSLSTTLSIPSFDFNTAIWGDGGNVGYSAIFTQGNVGIGTTSPANLFSVGDASQFNVTSAGSINIKNYTHYSGQINSFTSNSSEWLKIASFSLNSTYRRNELVFTLVGGATYISTYYGETKIYLRVSTNASGANTPEFYYSTVGNSFLKATKLVQTSSTFPYTYELWVQNNPSQDGRYSVTVQSGGTESHKSDLVIHEDGVFQSSAPTGVAVYDGSMLYGFDSTTATFPKSVTISTPSSGIALSLGRVSGQPSIKSIADWLIMDSNTSPAALNYYSSQNVSLAYGGGNVGIGINNPAITLAIGDSDTGFKWISDGNLAVYTNNAERMRIASNGRVGLGSTSPSVKFQVKSTTTTNDGMILENGTSWLRLLPGTTGGGSYNPLSKSGDIALLFSSGTVDNGELFIAPWSNNASGLRITSNQYVSVVQRSLASNAQADTVLEGLGAYHSSQGVWGTVFYEYYTDSSNVARVLSRTGTAIDLAEWFYVGQSSIGSNSHSTLVKGNLVCADEASKEKIVACNSENQKIIGAVSTKPYTTMGENSISADRSQSEEIALVGRIPLMVTSKNGDIEIGDYITLSNLEGVGQKATKSGQIIGTSLEDFTTTACTPASSLESIVWPADDGHNETKPCFRLPDGTYVGKIMLFLSISWYDPSLSSTTETLTEPGWYRISKLDNSNDYAKIKINNSAIGSSQNLILSVDSINSNNSINVISNFTTGGNNISKARVNTVNGTKYLEVYLGTVNNNSIKVSIENGDTTNWITTNIVKVEDGMGIIEYALEGVLFGTSEAFTIKKDSITTSGTLLTSSLTSDIGNNTNRWNDIYTKGTIRLGSGSSEGGIRYNVEKKRLEFSNDGSIWIEMGDLTSSVVISPEYSGAILYADGSDNYGRMTSDAIETGGVFKNYYEWKSDRETLQDYDILVRITLPTDFVSWKENAISLDFMTENSASVANNKVDLALMGNSGIDGEVKDGISKLPGSWERVSIKSTDITQCKKAGDSCTVRLSMHSKENYFVRVGDISLNYNRGL